MATAAEKRRAVSEAVGSRPAGEDVTVIDGRSGRAVARRPGSGDAPSACLLVLAPLGLARFGGRAPSVRPARLGDIEAMLAPADRRRVRRERHQRLHAHKAAREARHQAARGATSAPHGATGGDPRPGASAEAAAPHTRPRVIVPD